jgi:elongation factor Ts
MTTVTITAADVNKLRTTTGAGMMDCKKALTESGGDFEKAIDYLRKKGQKVAANRGDRDAKEGQVIAKVTADKKRGTIICLNCETDFVAINADFGSFANSILETANSTNPSSIDELKDSSIDGIKISDRILDYVAKIGEKIELSRYETVNAEYVYSYIHPGNKLATIVGFNQSNVSDVDASILEREVEIAKEQARQEGKPEEMLEKIAQGKIQKFYKESTLLNQEYIKDNKMTVNQYVKSIDKDLAITGFKRVSLV